MIIAPHQSKKTNVVYKNAAVSASTSVTIPAHQAGDIILMWAGRQGNVTAPTVPTSSGTVPAWITINTASGSSMSAVLTYFIATDSTTTSGTWTNATHTMAAVLAGNTSTSSIGGGNVRASVANPSFAGGAMYAPSGSNIKDISGTSQYLLFCLGSQPTGNNSGGWGNAISAITIRLGSATTTEYALFTTNSTTSGNGGIGSIGNSSAITVNYCVNSVEIVSR